METYWILEFISECLLCRRERNSVDVAVTQKAKMIAAMREFPDFARRNFKAMGINTFTSLAFPCTCDGNPAMPWSSRSTR